MRRLDENCVKIGSLKLETPQRDFVLMNPIGGKWPTIFAAISGLFFEDEIPENHLLPACAAQVHAKTDAAVKFLCFGNFNLSNQLPFHLLCWPFVACWAIELH